MKGQTNSESSQRPGWFRRLGPYAIVCLVAVSAGALYASPRGLTWSRRRIAPRAGLAGVARCAGCVGGGISKPDGPVGSAAMDPFADIRQEVLTYYRSRYRDDDPGVSTQVTDYGCHVGVDVVKDGKVVKSFAYFGKGQFYEQGW